MENIIEKLGLYDIFARGLTGTIVVLAADLFGILDLCSTSEDSATIPVWAILVAGYFCGLVLEEISYMREKLLHTRKKIEKKVCDNSKYKDYLYEKCKDVLLVNGKNDICDEPLAHIVMSASFEIAFFIFFVLKLLNFIPYWEIVSGNFVGPIMDMVILVVLIIIFHLRARHYCQRRAEQIFDYCIAKHYPDIVKERI